MSMPQYCIHDKASETTQKNNNTLHEGTMRANPIGNNDAKEFFVDEDLRSDKTTETESVSSTTTAQVLASPARRRRWCFCIIIAGIGLPLFLLLVAFLLCSSPGFFNLIFGAKVYDLVDLRNPFETFRKRKIQCFLSMTRSYYAMGNEGPPAEFYAEGAKVHLAATGSYSGIEGASEYVKYVYAANNPLFKTGFETGAASAVRVDGFEDGVCKFSYVRFQRFTLADEFSPETGPSAIDTAYLSRVGLDIKSGKIVTNRSYISPATTKWLFGTASENGNLAGYICDNVLNDACGAPEENCVERFSALPLYEEAYGSVDGNTVGCRALHAVFALTNQNHCPHVALTPTPDRNGEIKCFESKNMDPLSLFDDKDIEFYNEETISRGIDPSEGMLVVL